MLTETTAQDLIMENTEIMQQKCCPALLMLDDPPSVLTDKETLLLALQSIRLHKSFWNIRPSWEAFKSSHSRINLQML